MVTQRWPFFEVGGSVMVCIRDNICTECNRIEEDSTYSYKGHYNAASLWNKVHYGVGISMTVIAAWAGVDALSSDPNLAAYLALGSATLGALQTFLGASDKAMRHKSSAGEYLALRNQTRLFREVKLSNMDASEAQERISQFSEERDKLNRISPAIPYYAFKKAKEGIDEGQAKYRIDKGGT